MKEETDPMGQNLDLPIVKIGDQHQNWRLPIIDRTTIPDNASSWSKTPLLGLGREKLRKSAKNISKYKGYILLGTCQNFVAACQFVLKKISRISLNKLLLQFGQTLQQFPVDHAEWSSRPPCCTILIEPNPTKP